MDDINKNDDKDLTNSQAVISDSDSTDDEQPRENVIDTIYKSMSKIIEALNTDNLILNQQVQKIRNELEFVCNTVANMKVENQDLINTYTSEINHISDQLQALSEHRADSSIHDEFLKLQTLVSRLHHDMEALKSENDRIADLQKQMLDMRTMLLQMITSNINNLRKEFSDSRKVKDDVRSTIKLIIAEEMKDYMSKIPSLEQRFEELAREQRLSLAQNIRKSTVQRVNSLQTDTVSILDAVRQQIKDTDKSSDIEFLKKQQLEFMTRVETLLTAMKTKIEGLSNKETL